MTHPTLPLNLPIRVVFKWDSEGDMEIRWHAVTSVNLSLRPCSWECFSSSLDPINVQNIVMQMCTLIDCLSLVLSWREKLCSGLSYLLPK